MMGLLTADFFVSGGVHSPFCSCNLWSCIPPPVLLKSMQEPPVSSKYPSSPLPWPLAPSPRHQVLLVHPCFTSLLRSHLQVTAHLTLCSLIPHSHSTSLAAWLLIPPTQKGLQCAQKGDGFHFIRQEFVGSVGSSGKCVQLADGQRGLEIQEDTKAGGRKSRIIRLRCYGHTQNLLIA